MFKICIICLMLKTKEKYFFLYTCILSKCIQLLKAMYGCLLATCIILTTQLLTFHAVDEVCLPTMYNVDSVK